MEESVADASNKLQFSFCGMKLMVSGTIARVVSVAVSLLILAVAYKVTGL